MINPGTRAQQIRCARALATSRPGFPRWISFRVISWWFCQDSRQTARLARDRHKIVWCFTVNSHNRWYPDLRLARALTEPVKSPWLNPIEPRWLHGKRAIVEPDGPLTAHELMDRVHQHFGCEPLEPLHQHVL